MAEKKQLIKGLYNWVLLGIIIVSLILINIISSFVYKRFDYNERSKVFTL